MNQEKTKEEKTKEYNSKYYAKNKDKLLTKIKEKKLCNICNKMIASSNFSKHLKSKYCMPIESMEALKLEKKVKKINELNEYITQMNKLYETDVPLIQIP